MSDVRPIPGFLGYSVDNLGRVFSTKRGGERQLKAKPGNDGYLSVNLFRDGAPTKIAIHRLVLMAWVGPCPAKQECRHLDGDKLNNSLSNLAWGTKSENANDTYLMGRWTPPAKRLNQSDVNLIRSRVAAGENRVSVAEDYGVTPQHVWHIVNRSRWGALK